MTKRVISPRRTKESNKAEASPKQEKTPPAKPATNIEPPHKQTPPKENKRKGSSEKSIVPEVTALALFFISLFTLMSTLSYLVSWENDQSVAHWGAMLESSDLDIENHGGKLGAILAETFMGRWFGVFGLLIPILMISTSFILMRIHTHLYRKLLITMTSLMVIGSIGAATLAPESMDNVFGSSIGGAFGYHISELLNEYVGDYGSAIAVVMLFAIWAVCALRSYTQKIMATLVKIYDIVRGVIMIPFTLIGITSFLVRGTQKKLERTKANKRASFNNINAKSQDDEEEDVHFENVEGNEHALDEIDDEYIGDEYIAEEDPDENLIDKDSVIQPLDQELEQEHYEPIFEIEGNELEHDSNQHYPSQEPDESSEPEFEIEHRPIATPAPRPKPTKPQDPETMLMDYGNCVILDIPLAENIEGQNTSSQEDSDDDMFRLIDKSEPKQAATEPKPVVEQNANEIEFEIVEPTQEAPQPSSSAVIFEVEKPSHSQAIASEQESDSTPFEIEVTSNANVAPIDNSDVVISTNVAQQTDDIDESVYDPTRELSSYKRPSVDLLENRIKRVEVSPEELIENKKNIVETLENFGIAIKKIKATIGPTVTLYEVVPDKGVRIAKIKNLEDDIALSLKALGIRIIAPIPGKGTIGIEVPNKDKEIVSMYSVIKSVKFQESEAELPVVIGRTIQNEDFIFDMAKMPHLLIAGATGQGKSVGLNAIITSLIYKKHPAELKFVLIDPKKVEFSLYSHIEKHFLATLPDSEESVITDFQKVIYTLNSLCIEMDTRYDLLKKAKVRNIKEYNARFTQRKLNPHNGHRYLPYFVVVIDEFGDLIMTAGREIETPIARIAQLARAVGIHMIIATQRPSVSIITGAIKANFPARMAFRVATMVDSRTILDQPGANQLIGMGDMLISTGSDITRVQCAFVDTPEVERIVEYIGEQRGYPNVYELPEYVPEGSDKASSNEPIKRDALFTEVARYVVTNQQGSASTIQRNFSIGFNRAGRVMDQLERAGIVGRQEGSKPRQVLIQDVASLEVMLYDMENNNDLI